MEFKYVTGSTGIFDIDDFDTYVKENFEYDLTQENINDLLQSFEEEPFHFDGGQLISAIEDNCYQEELSHGGNIWEQIDERLFQITNDNK